MASSIDVTPENFVHAVQMLYHDQDATKKRLASEWLQNVQSSLYAWSLADQLIRMNQNSEVTCLAAQILRHKIQHHFDELPIEHCQGLCYSLLDHLSRPELTRYPTVRVQLAVATADLALQYIGWENPVGDVVERLKISHEHILTLLEFLTALPEEVDTSTIRIGENRRRFCQEKYSNSGKEIHDILVFFLRLESAYNENLFIGVFKSFASWVSIRAFDENLLLSSPILSTVLDILKASQSSNEIHKHACNCLCSILELCEDNQKYWSLIVYLKQQIMQHLFQPYSQAVNEENLDKAQNYTRIYTNLIESILDCLLDGRHSELSDLSCLHLLLYASEHTDYEVVQSTFYTWYRLSDLIKVNNSDLVDQVKPYMDRLIEILCKQCKLDSDHMGIPPEIDERHSKVAGSSDSDFAEFRYRIECLIKDTIHISEPINCFQRMSNKLQSCLSLSWEEIEAPLYIMSCVASSLSSMEDQLVPRVIQIILSTKAVNVHKALKYTGIRLLGQLDHWIEKNDPQLLKSILDHLLSMLIDEELRPTSAESILKISSECKKQLIPHFDQILKATLWLNQIELGSEASQCLLKTSSKLLSRLPSNDDVHRCLGLLFDQQIQYLTQILSTPTETNYSTIIKHLDCLTAMFRSFDFKIRSDEPHPCANFVEQLLPLFDIIIVRYRSSVKLSESWSRSIRFIIRSMQSHAKAFYQPIVHLIIASYDEVAHSCFLYLISIIVDEFGDNPDFKSSVILISEHLTKKTFSILPNPDAFKQKPDIVDDFYRLSSRLLQRCPLEYLKSSVIRPIIENIIPNCQLEHRDASASMITFLQSLVKLVAPSKKDNQMKIEIRQLAVSLCEKYFSDILSGLMHAIVIHRVPSSIRSTIAEFICDLKTYLADKYRHWLKKSLEDLPRKTRNGHVEIVTIQQQEQFYQKLCEADAQPSTIEYELETFARLYR